MSLRLVGSSLTKVLTLTILFCLLTPFSQADEMAQVEMLRRVFTRPMGEWKQILSEYRSLLTNDFFQKVRLRIRWSVNHNHVDDAVRFAIMGDMASEITGRHENYRLGLAEAFINAGNLALGSQLLDNIRLTDPNNKTAMFLKAQILETQGDTLLDAYNLYKKLLDEGYQKSECLYRMGRLSLEMGKDSRARKELEHCLKISPHHKKARQALNDLLRRYGIATNSTPASTSNSTGTTTSADYLAQAEKNLQKNDLAAAELLYLRALEEDPNNATAEMYLGALYYRLGKLDLAVSYIEKAVKTAPNEFEAWRYLGNSYERIFDTRGDTESLNKAIAAYERGLKLRPNDPLIQSELKRAQAKLQTPPTAVRQ